MNPHLVSFLQPRSFVAEQYRRLRQRVEDLGSSKPMQVITVTSPAASDGKTLTSLNLAMAFARAPEARVLIIDADLRQPNVASNLKLSPDTKGWPDWAVSSDASFESYAQPCGDGLWVLTAGTPTADTYELLRSPRLTQMLTEARQKYDYVIIDTPPILMVPDSGLLAGAVDGYIIVVSANSTPRKLLAESLAQLEPSRVIGLVFNRDRRPIHGYYRGYYRQYFQSYVRSTGA